MAVEEGDLESGRLKERLDSLLNTGGIDENRLESNKYCSRFCELVKEHTGHWHVPLPQLQVLRTALSCFSQCTVSFPSDCETVRCVLSSFALSFFELLLYFGKEEFLKDPLRGILDTFQECHSYLVRHRNAYLLLVSKVIQGGGPWEHAVLQAILKESPQPQEEVDKFLSSECPIFFELRVRYLLTCGRIQEAVALAKCCIAHPEVGKHLYFHQAYLTCLWKASHYDQLYKGIAMIDGRDAVEIICNSESEEKDELLLALCKAFLTRQLQTGDMYYLWDLIFIWSKLHLRLDPSKQNFLGECHELMMNATNVRSIFPFIKIIRAELRSEGLEFCVELCARALQMDLRHDPVTASLIYKTIAYLLPTDLDICRACALLVFFQERTVESYKTAYLLYLHPDQEYHVDCSVIKNHMRFEILQILKKGLYFDPEFWNLITLRKNCLKLMNEKVMKAALIEIMEEDKWIPKFYGKEPYKLHYDTSELHTKKVEQSVNCRRKTLTKRIVVPPEVTVVSHVKKRGRKPGSRVIRVVDDAQLRQSDRPCDVAQEKTVCFYNSRDLPELTKNDKNALKRRGRKPRWLLQQAAVEAEKRNPKQTECLDDKTLLPAMDFKKPECTTSEMGEEMEKASKSSQEQAENIKSIHPTVRGIIREPDCFHEETSRAVSQVQNTVLQISLPDREVTNAGSLEQNMEAVTPSSTSSQHVILEDTPRAQKLPTEAENFRNVQEPCEMEVDHATQSGEDLEFSLPSSLEKTKICEESAIEMDIAIIQQFHNYCKAPTANVEDVQVLVAMSEQFISAVPLESSLRSTESVQEVSGEISESSSLEKEKSPQQALVEIGVGSPREFGLVKPGCPAKVVVEEAKMVENKILQCAKTSETLVEEIIPDGTAHNPHVTICSLDDVKKSSETHAEVLQNTDRGSDNILSHPENIPHVSETINHVFRNSDSPDDTTLVLSSTDSVSKIVSQASSTPEHDVGISIGIQDDTAVASSSTDSVADSLLQASSPTPEQEDGNLASIHDDTAVAQSNTDTLADAVPHTPCSTPEHDVGNSIGIQDDTAVASSSTDSVADSLPQASSPTPEQADGNLASIHDDTAVAQSNADAVPHTSRSTPEHDVGNSVSISNDSTVVCNSTHSLTQATSSFIPEQVVGAPVNIPDDSAVMPSSADSVTQAPSSTHEHAAGISVSIADDTTVAIGCTDTASQAPSSPSPEVVVLPSALSKPDKMASDTPLEAPLPSALPKTENPLLTHRCRLCNEELRGGNIMRHAVAHLQKDKLKCIFCGTLFSRRLIAKRHVVEHIDKLKISSNNVKSVEKRTESLRCVTQSLPPKGKHKNKSATGMQLRASSRKRKRHHEPQHFNTTKSSSPEKAGRLLRNGSVNRRVSRREAYCCPADGCGRTFLRKGLLVIRHAMKSHPRDIKVQEYAFQWRKGKCEFCQRQFKSLQHFQDHAKTHEHPLKHVCYHHDCRDRFKTHSELRDHMKSHQPLQAQCGFAGCFQRFRQLSRLHSHEHKHYVPPETKSKSSKTPPGDSSVQNEGKQKRFSGPCKPGHSTLKGPIMAKTDGKTDIENTAEVKDKKAGDVSLAKSTICGTSAGQLANGHATYEDVVPAAWAWVDSKAGNSQECNQETRERDKIKSEIDKGPQEHPTQGQKRVKSEDQSPYGRMSNQPFVRPPPTAYLDEKFISMPKRSKSLAGFSSSREHNSCRDVPQRQRCPKCFSSFPSAEALQSHLSSDKCTSLFGFDSDEESAC